MIKQLLISLLAVSCFGQGFSFGFDQPYFAGKLFGGISWNGTPENLGGMAFHWVYTNATTGTNWIDLIHGAQLNWNKVLTAPSLTSSGILSTASTGNRDALTNFSLGSFGTNFSMFFVCEQINNNFLIPGNFEPLISGSSSSIYIGNSGTSSSLFVVYAGQTPNITASINNIPIDCYLTWSNGMFWAWTNGIKSINAMVWNNSTVPWNVGVSLFSDNPNPVSDVWHGTIAEYGIYTNLFFTDITVSNLHYYVTNVVRMTGITP